MLPIIHATHAIHSVFSDIISQVKALTIENLDFGAKICYDIFKKVGEIMSRPGLEMDPRPMLAESLEAMSTCAEFFGIEDERMRLSWAEATMQAFSPLEGSCKKPKILDDVMPTTHMTADTPGAAVAAVTAATAVVEAGMSGMPALDTAAVME